MVMTVMWRRHDGRSEVGLETFREKSAKSTTVHVRALSKNGVHFVTTKLAPFSEVNVSSFASLYLLELTQYQNRVHSKGTFSYFDRVNY
jgi:hypothetical protein